MPDHIKTEFDYPPYPSTTVAWARRALDAAEKLRELNEYTRYFLSRKSYDSRLRRDGKYVDGEFIDTPLRRTLCYGTPEEVQKGFVMNTDKHWIKPYSMSTDLSLEIVIPTGNYNIDGYSVKDPAWMAWNAFETHWKIEECEYIGIVQGAPSSEHAALFFPIGIYKNCVDARSVYLIFEVGGSYGEVRVYLFEGDPEEYCRDIARLPRTSEFMEARENGTVAELRAKKACPAPVELPMDYDPKTYTPINPRKFKITEWPRAYEVLKTTGNEHGAWLDRR